MANLYLYNKAKRLAIKFNNMRFYFFLEAKCLKEHLKYVIIFCYQSKLYINDIIYHKWGILRVKWIKNRIFHIFTIDYKSSSCGYCTREWLQRNEFSYWVETIEWSWKGFGSRFYHQIPAEFLRGLCTYDFVVIVEKLSSPYVHWTADSTFGHRRSGVCNKKCQVMSFTLVHTHEKSEFSDDSISFIIIFLLILLNFFESNRVLHFSLFSLS